MNAVKETIALNNASGFKGLCKSLQKGLVPSGEGIRNSVQPKSESIFTLLGTDGTDYNPPSRPASPCTTGVFNFHVDYSQYLGIHETQDWKKGEKDKKEKKKKEKKVSSKDSEVKAESPGEGKEKMT
jgi:hypothetical protein